MALRVFEGWDHYGTAAGDMLQRQGLLQWTTQPDCSFIAGRNGYGKALQLSSTTFGSLLGTLSATFATFFLGLALEEVPSGETFSVVPYDATASAPQYSVNFASNTGIITIVSGATTLFTSAANAFSPYVWNYIEVGGTISSSAGTVVVRVNGATVASLSGVDNQATGHAYMNGIEFSLAGSGASVANIDDFYLCDNTTGPGTYPCNTFLGDVSVDTLFPVSNGSISWTPLTGTNWSEVSEIAMDGDTSYNYTTGASNVDTFGVGALRAATNTVFGVQVTGAYRKDDATSHTLQQRIVSGSTTGDGTTASIPSGYVYLTDLFVLDPNTSATWLAANVNAAKIGYSLIS